MYLCSMLEDNSSHDSDNSKFVADARIRISGTRQPIPDWFSRRQPIQDASATEYDRRFGHCHESSCFSVGATIDSFLLFSPLLVEYIVHEFSQPHTSVSIPPSPPFTTDLKRSDFGRWTHRSTIEVVGCPPLSRRMDGLTAWPPPKPCIQETHRRLPSD